MRLELLQVILNLQGWVLSVVWQMKLSSLLRCGQIWHLGLVQRFLDLFLDPVIVEKDLLFRMEISL